MARERPSTTDHPQPRDAREPCHPHGADRDRDRLRGGGPSPRARGDRPRRHPPRDRRARLRHARARQRGGQAGAARRRVPRTTPPPPGMRRCARRSPTTSARTRASPSTPEHVVVTPGAKPIMFYAMLALVERGRRGHLPRTPASRSTSRWPRFVGGTPGAGPAARGERLPDGRRRAGVARHRSHAADRHQLARTTRPAVDPDRGRPARDRRDRGRARPRRPGRRDLRPPPVRGRAPLASPRCRAWRSARSCSTASRRRTP